MCIYYRLCTYIHTQDLHGSGGHGTSSTTLGRFKNLFGGKGSKSHSAITRTTTTSLPQSNARHPSGGDDDDDDDDDEEVQQYVVIIVTGPATINRVCANYTKLYFR